MRITFLIATLIRIDAFLPIAQPPDNKEKFSLQFFYWFAIYYGNNIKLTVALLTFTFTKTFIKSKIKIIDFTLQ